MKWPWHKDRSGESAGKMVAAKAVDDAEYGKRSAEIRWRDVNTVTDEFATAVEKAMRRTR